MDRRSWWVALVGLVALVGFWWLRNSATPPVPVAPGAGAGVAGSATGDLAASPGMAVAAEAQVDRTPVAAPLQPEDGRDADEPTSEVLVQVVWADDTPAPGIHVHVACHDIPGVSRPLAALVSDAAGQARTRVPLGRVRLTSDRGARAEADVVADEVREVRLQLKVGVDVEGVVRDPAGAPVAGARVWLSTYDSAWCAGSFVANSDALGTFRVRAVPKQQSLGAVAAGFAPSNLVDLDLADTTKAPVRIELVLGDAGGALAGRVVDEQGRGVAGAIVAVGTSDQTYGHRNSGTREERWAPRRATTHADGRYAIEGLQPGEHPVEVWARAFPFWRGQCTIAAGGAGRLDITLQRGVTLHGVVTGEDGQPLAGAVVRVFPAAISTRFLQGGQYDYESTFGYPSATADAAGCYRLLRAAPGELHAYASAGGRRRMGDVVPWANEVLQGEPGATVEWNPRIDPGLQVRGVVRHRDGVPMGDVFLTLLGGKQGDQTLVNDTEGRFRFVRLQKQAYDVSVQVRMAPKGAPPVEARGVWPDTGELEIVAAFDSPKKLANGSVRGAIADTAGRLANPGALAVILTSERGSWNTNPKLDGGTFRFADVEPGRRRIVVMSGEAPILYGPWFELQPAEQKDIGTLVTEPGGSLLLCVVRHPGTEAVEAVVHVTPVGASHGRKVTAGMGVTELTIDNLCAGEQRLSSYPTGAVPIREVRCTVVAGAQARATIELHAAVAREIVVESGEAQRITRIRVQDERGAQFFDYRPTLLLDRPYRMKLNLPLGRFTFRVETEGGGIAQTEFEMTSLAPDQPPVVLQAK